VRFSQSKAPRRIVVGVRYASGRRDETKSGVHLASFHGVGSGRDSRLVSEALNLSVTSELEPFVIWTAGEMGKWTRVDKEWEVGGRGPGGQGFNGPLEAEPRKLR